MSSSDYCPNTPEEIADMLDTIGVAAIDDLFDVIPPHLRPASFNLPQGISEFEMLSRLRSLAGKNRGDIIHFIGGGFYDHLIPSVVDHLAARSEFYTAYTPYQAECSQGTLQAMYEYQSAICALTGMEVSNASLYDGGTAVAEAALMALRITGRTKVIVDRGVNPLYRRVLGTYLCSLKADLLESAVPSEKDPAGFKSLVDDSTAAVVVQNPDFLGSIHDFTELSEKAHSVGAVVVASVYPISLGLVKSPGEMGIDIVCGDGQSLGNHMSFGGPSFGFIATGKKHVRNLPGRIIGETVSGEGKRGFVLTLQAREQHIRRHRATSNICSNESLCALRGLIFLSTLGREGLMELARLNRDKAEYAKRRLTSIKGISLVNTAPTFNEFTLTLPGDAGAVAQKLLQKGVAAGVPMGKWYPEMSRAMVVTVTEKRTREEIDALASALEESIWS